MISDLTKGDASGLSGALPPVVSVISNTDVTINSATPVTILVAQIELDSPSKILISGVVSGAFARVNGIAIYVDDVPINNRNNPCHSDCMQIIYAHWADNKMLSVPFECATDVLAAGVHVVRVGTLSNWYGNAHTTYVNNGRNGDTPSSSTLTLRAI